MKSIEGSWDTEMLKDEIAEALRLAQGNDDLTRLIYERLKPSDKLKESDLDTMLTPELVEAVRLFRVLRKMPARPLYRNDGTSSGSRNIVGLGNNSRAYQRLNRLLKEGIIESHQAGYQMTRWTLTAKGLEIAAMKIEE